MRKVLLVLVIVLSFAASAAAQSDLDRRLRAAVAKLDQGDALGAFLDLEGILTRDDKYWAAYYHLGRAQVQMGDDLGARQSFQRAAELNPGNPDLHFMIATAAWQLADFEATWSQGIAAWQSGYDTVRVQQLFDQVAQYSGAPGDLQMRLDAPKVIVVAPQADDDPALEELALEMRTELYRAPLIALVREPSIARYEVVVERQQDGRLELALRDIEADAELGSRLLRLSDKGLDADALMSLSSFVEDIQAWIPE
jgi:tetratricopeptide (TPR) repeat protein